MPGVVHAVGRPEEGSAVAAVGRAQEIGVALDLVADRGQAEPIEVRVRPGVVGHLNLAGVHHRAQRGRVIRPRRVHAVDEERQSGPGVAAELAEGGDDRAAGPVVHGEGQLIAGTRQVGQHTDRRRHPCQRNHQPHCACHRRPGDRRDDSCRDRGQHGAPINARHDEIVLGSRGKPNSFPSVCFSFASGAAAGFRGPEGARTLRTGRPAGGGGMNGGRTRRVRPRVPRRLANAVTELRRSPAQQIALVIWWEHTARRQR